MRSVTHSIRGRLLVWLLAGTAVLGSLALFDTWREAQETANEVSDRVLAGSALAIAERVVVAEDGSLEVDIPYVALEMLTSAAQDRVFYRVDGPSGQFITGYQTLPTLAQKEGQAAVFEDLLFRGDPIRVATLARSASTGISSVPFTVTVAETTIARRQLASSILLHSALRLILMMSGAAAIVWIAVSFALKPLNRLGAAITLRNPEDLEPIQEVVPSEVEGLVETINSFMIRLQSSLEALRHFTGNASHQLRTPLAVVRTQLALAARSNDPDMAKAAIEHADAAIARAERVLAQLLTMSRLDATPAAIANMERVDLVSLARDVTGDYVPAAAEAGIDLGFEGEGEAHIRGEPLLLAELLKNLISNALLYAGNRAEVTTRVVLTPKDVRLEVEDNGPGIPPNKLKSVMRRFDRADRADERGTGLGLPIVEEIVTVHGGTVTLATGANGRGLIVKIDLPADSQT